jgi:hypothetical protein
LVGDLPPSLRGDIPTLKDPFVMRAFEKGPFGVVAPGRLARVRATSAVKGAFTA